MNSISMQANLENGRSYQENDKLKKVFVIIGRALLSQILTVM